MRAGVSSAPPGANGTIKRETRTGQAFCASLRKAEKLPMRAKRRKFLRLTNLKLRAQKTYQLHAEAAKRSSMEYTRKVAGCMDASSRASLSAFSVPIGNLRGPNDAVDGPRACRSRSHV